MSSTVQKAWIQVYDRVVRYGHRALVIAFASAYLAGEEKIGGTDHLHVWAGYAVGTIVAIRLVWGFIGTRHARFSDFSYNPVTALRYFAQMLHAWGNAISGIVRPEPI